VHARANGWFSFWLLVLAATMLFTPNGMNRVGTTSTGVPATELLKRIAGHVRPLVGTRVAARCVDRKGREVVVDLDEQCGAGMARSTVIVQPDHSVAEGLPAAEATRPPRADADPQATQQQCTALNDLMRVIEDEANRRPWPEARQDELLALREKAREERQRLSC
jgi:hypothetical protein